MSEIVSDPTTLTKDALKRELSRLNVPLPRSDSRKEVYVELYREHVLAKRVSEFSSDDEIVTKTQSKSPRKKTASPKKSPKKSLSKENKEEQTMDVTELSDDELLQKLKDLGVDAGPIVDSTRRVYQKKLASLLAEGVSAEGPHRKVVTEEKVVSYEEADTQIITESQSINDSIPVSDSDDDVKVEAALVTPVKPSTIRQRPPVRSAARDTGHTDRTDRGYDRDETIPLKPVSSAHNSTKVPQPSEPQKKGFSILTQVLIFVAVAVLIYVIMMSMDSRPRSLIPSEAKT